MQTFESKHLAERLTLGPALKSRTVSVVFGFQYLETVAT